MQSDIGVEPDKNPGEVWLSGAAVAAFVAAATPAIALIIGLFFVFVPAVVAVTLVAHFAQVIVYPR